MVEICRFYCRSHCYNGHVKLPVASVALCGYPVKGNGFKSGIFLELEGENLYLLSKNRTKAKQVK